MNINERFDPNGCLRFPQILMQFYPSKEQDDEVTEHLRSCPRCWNLFNSVVQADTPAVETAMSEFDEYETTASYEEKEEKERLVYEKTERLIYDFLFGDLYDSGKLKEIKNSGILFLAKEGRKYFQKYVDFISRVNASAR